MKTLLNILFVISFAFSNVYAGLGAKPSSSSSSKSSSSTVVKINNTGTAAAKSSTYFAPPKSSSAAPKSTPASTPALTSKPTGWGTTNKTPTPVVSPTTSKPVNLYNEKKAITQTTAKPAPPTKVPDSFVNDYKKKNANVYVNNFTTQPVNRPAYIPPTYVTGGHTYNIVYDNTRHGYGYFDALGTFILYDALTERAQAQYYHDVYASPQYSQPVYVASSSSSHVLLYVFLTFFVVALLFLVVAKFI